MVCCTTVFMAGQTPNQINSSGSGEAILKSRVASRVAEMFRSGLDLEQATRSALLTSADQDVEASCGVIALTVDGQMTSACNARTFAVASAGSACEANARIIPNSFTHITGLVFYKDADCTIGYAKYPVMDGQAILELHSAQSLVHLDRALFETVWKTLARTVKALMSSHGQSSCSCTALGRIIQIFPHSSASMLQRQYIFPQSREHPSSKDTWRYIFEATQELNVSSASREELQVNLYFAKEDKVHFNLERLRNTTSKFPECAQFHDTFPGHTLTEAGSRAKNLGDLKRRTKLLSAAFQQA